MNWNRCRIVIGPGQNQRQVAEALRRLATMIQSDKWPIAAGTVAVLRDDMERLVGAATFSKVEDER